MKTILTELYNGWMWPNNWNKEAKRLGYAAALIPKCNYPRRFWRAISWAWSGFREVLADWIAP